MLLVISIFHFNPILTPFLNYGLNATQNLYMFAVDLGGLFFLHILDMATGKCFTDYLSVHSGQSRSGTPGSFIVRSLIKAEKSWNYNLLVCFYNPTRIWSTYKRRLAKVLIQKNPRRPIRLLIMTHNLGFMTC